MRVEIGRVDKGLAWRFRLVHQMRGPKANMLVLDKVLAASTVEFLIKWGKLFLSLCG